jgi:single-stranded-DNA-specific exonuclease
MRWVLGEATAQPGAEGAARLAAELGLRPATGRALWARGHRDAEAAARFLEPRLDHLPDPFGLKGIEAAVGRLTRALEAREAICIYGDYDVDGVTSTALLVSVLRKLAACAPGPQAPAKVDFYVPHRLVEGYGLNLAALGKIAARGARLLVSADCGVTAVAEIDGAARLGLDVVVIDHHTSAQLAEDLPRAVAILNPHQPGCAFPGRELVALGTIADVVPLTGANRVLVHFGLKEIGRGARPGLVALKAVAQVTGEVSASDVGFKLGPRINAAGRLDDASVGVRLLLSEDPVEARRLAEQLDRANAERQDLQQRIAVEAIEQAARLGPPEERRMLVVSSPGWHAGVVGIVASRLVERFHRPALVLAEEGDQAKGSGRSVEGFHLYDALARCTAHLTRFGGHRHAAGVTVQKSALPALAEALEAQARAQLDPALLTPRLRVDAVLAPGEIDLALARELSRLAPFGAGNPEPVFGCPELLAHEVRVLSSRRGAGDGPGHLKLRLLAPPEQGSTPTAADRPHARDGVFDAIGFGLGGLSVQRGARLAAAFQLSLDRFGGDERLQLKLKDLREPGIS